MHHANISDLSFPYQVGVLQDAGFSLEQIGVLIRLRDEFGQNKDASTNEDRNRLEFYRWLYLQGRLES